MAYAKGHILRPTLTQGRTPNGASLKISCPGAPTGLKSGPDWYRREKTSTESGVRDRIVCVWRELEGVGSGERGSAGVTGVTGRREGGVDERDGLGSRGKGRRGEVKLNLTKRRLLAISIALQNRRPVCENRPRNIVT